MKRDHIKCTERSREASVEEQMHDRTNAHPKDKSQLIAARVLPFGVTTLRLKARSQDVENDSDGDDPGPTAA